jgi:hypothetical protein
MSKPKPFDHKAYKTVKDQRTGRNYGIGHIEYQPGVYKNWARKLNDVTARELRNSKKSRYEYIQEE